MTPERRQVLQEDYDSLSDEQRAQAGRDLAAILPTMARALTALSDAVKVSARVRLAIVELPPELLDRL